MSEQNVERSQTDPASENAGGEIANLEDQNPAECVKPRTESAPGRLPARASRTGEAFRFYL
jgi:hypothetical protein